ncbi:MAG TPA: hypothetical protein VNM14_20375 [Planctomycetota bacterium]|jgi:hypothetical protein|nr:hypothetical protein [Planctomycetota bacterium]
MIITCQHCNRKHPLTDDDVAYFYPRFFCLSCGKKLEFKLPDAKILELKHSNDPSRKLTDDLSALPPQTEFRKVAAGTRDMESNG